MTRNEYYCFRRYHYKSHQYSDQPLSFTFVCLNKRVLTLHVFIVWMATSVLFFFFKLKCRGFKIYYWGTDIERLNLKSLMKHFSIFRHIYMLKTCTICIKNIAERKLTDPFIGPNFDIIALDWFLFGNMPGWFQ